VHALLVAVLIMLFGLRSRLPLLSEEPVIAPPEPDDLEPFWSVTTLIGCLDKPALVYWTALETAKAAIDDHDVWMHRLEHEGRDSALQYLKGARFRRGRGQRSATELGTAVHKACEHMAINGRWQPKDWNDGELRPFLIQFECFLNDWQPEYIAAEVTIFNVTYRFAGTCDGFFRLQRVPLIFDIKTSASDTLADGKLRTPFPEVGLQLAAYAGGGPQFYDEGDGMPPPIAAVWRARQSEQFKRRYYLLSETERALGVPVPEVDGAVALLLTPTRYALHPVKADDEVFELFLHVIDAAHFAFEVGPNVVKPPMIPPAREDDGTDPFKGLPT
jgi:hypothetical protein